MHRQNNCAWALCMSRHVKTWRGCSKSCVAATQSRLKCDSGHSGGEGQPGCSRSPVWPVTAPSFNLSAIAIAWLTHTEPALHGEHLLNSGIETKRWAGSPSAGFISVGVEEGKEQKPRPRRRRPLQTRPKQHDQKVARIRFRTLSSDASDKWMA